MLETGVKDELGEILARYSGDKSELISILQSAQERFGYLSGDVMARIADFLRLPASTVFGVATFYAQFKFIPTGRKVIRVCRGTACHVRGSLRILREAEKQLGIKSGETTEDLAYSLETVACFGSCALAPVMVVDKDVYGRMTTKTVGEILSAGG
ncbi:MAG: NADH-quinone oxidoreductase subunit NuoE [Chloroflexi bacterium]|nr:NADH-quinone oxidoreductase subunit NuoE [Chloroflexota bacterium]